MFFWIVRSNATTSILRITFTSSNSKSQISTVRAFLWTIFNVFCRMNTLRILHAQYRLSFLLQSNDWVYNKGTQPCRPAALHSSACEKGIKDEHQKAEKSFEG